MFTKVTEQRFKGHFSIDFYTIRFFATKEGALYWPLKIKYASCRFFFHFLQFFVVVYIKNKKTTHIAM